MTYQLHIERENRSISLEEWKAAVKAVKGVSLHPGEFGTTPNGEIIRFGSQDGDAEVYFPKQRTWHIVFRWFQGTASFTPAYPPGDLSYPAWRAAIALAARLNANIRSDRGEAFNLQSGEVMNA